MRLTLARLAVAGTAVAAVFAGTSAPAMAGDVQARITNKTISNDHGRMTFHDDGDMFEVCDTKADGHGVEGQLLEGSTTVLYLTDGGDAGCDKGGYDISWGKSYYMELAWSGGGPSVTSPAFSE
ncbi:hypothetical protein ACIRF8_34180 [Streptomyces sp. NPDC102406]|uniref:hypothetical protein n=1 Tax=Streptomyces sp. NPDC102406 TaxID=3366171 RepID=UPI00382E202B